MLKRCRRIRSYPDRWTDSESKIRTTLWKISVTNKRFNSEHERDFFLNEPRIASLIYQGPKGTPIGVPAWFDWDGKTILIFAFRNSPKIKCMGGKSNISVLVFNRVGEPEGWVAFDATVCISDIAENNWRPFLDRIAPRYWDLSDAVYFKEIEIWKEQSNSFVWLFFST